MKLRLVFKGSPAKFAITQWRIANDLATKHHAAPQSYCLFIDPPIFPGDGMPDGIHKTLPVESPELPPTLAKVVISISCDAPTPTVKRKKTLLVVARKFHATIEATEVADGGVELTVAANDKEWPYLKPQWELILAELRRGGWVKKKREPSGIRLGTNDRVKKFHQEMKRHGQVALASRLSNCDSRTYYKHCKSVTGEEPVAR